jgi:hypothetical protein
LKKLSGEVVADLTDFSADRGYHADIGYSKDVRNRFIEWISGRLM